MQDRFANLLKGFRHCLDPYDSSNIEFLNQNDFVSEALECLVGRLLELNVPLNSGAYEEIIKLSRSMDMLDEDVESLFRQVLKTQDPSTE